MCACVMCACVACGIASRADPPFSPFTWRAGTDGDALRADNGAPVLHPNPDPHRGEFSERGACISIISVSYCNAVH